MAIITRKPSSGGQSGPTTKAKPMPAGKPSAGTKSPGKPGTTRKFMSLLPVWAAEY